MARKDLRSKTREHCSAGAAGEPSLPCPHPWCQVWSSTAEQQLVRPVLCLAGQSIGSITVLNFQDFEAAVPITGILGNTLAMFVLQLSQRLFTSRSSPDVLPVGKRTPETHSKSV